MYEVLDDNPVTIAGLADTLNVAGEVEGVGVTIKVVAAPPVAGALNATDALPSLYARPEGTFVTTTEVGSPGGAAIGNHPFVV